VRGGIPLGGVYTGPGVDSVSGVFTPVLADSGIKLITYTYTNFYTCSISKTARISVLPSSGFTCGDLLTDMRDGKTYPTVQIGVQCWMSSNLNYGVMINRSSHQRDNCINEKYCFNGILTSCDEQGGLYQWDELMLYDDTPGRQGLCPPGWHVPSETDWNTVFTLWINNAFAGAPLKYTGYSGFDAYLSGVWLQNLRRDFTGFATFFWSSSAHGETRAWAHGMNSLDFSVSSYPSLRSNAFHIRCLQN
jgi:uncharacterized protein (TIGR02145 family)